MDLSLYWAKRSKKEFGLNPHKALFGIVQGGLFDDLRIESIKELINIGFDGYALGGLAVGETQNEMFEVLNNIKNYMPENKPRYLMGVGTPSDIIGAVKRGIDMFDCVLPTRSGRTGLAFTWNGRLNIRNAKYQKDNEPLDKNCTKFNLNKYSKNYLNHLFNTNEILASMILTLHNINFYQELMNEIRESIKKGTFDEFHDKYIDRL
jgi:queuine tRNA-ribosyltransferase